MVRKVNKWILNILLVVGVVVVIYSSYSGIRLYIDNNKTEEMINNIQLEVVGEVPEVSDSSNNNEVEASKGLELTLDFDKLLKINADTVAWIKVVGTNIDYPIVQTFDNSYYLNHSFDKSNNQNGWPFLNCGNSSTFDDQNTVLFGHNTNGTTMFSQLKDIYNGKFGNDISMYIYLEDKKIEYKVFSIYLEEPSNVASISRYLSSDFLEESIEKSNIKFGVDVSIDDYILTLSTCNNVTDDRIIMHARKL